MKERSENALFAVLVVCVSMEAPLHRNTGSTGIRRSERQAYIQADPAPFGFCGRDAKAVGADLCFLCLTEPALTDQFTLLHVLRSELI